MFLFPHKGVRNDRAKSRARGARMFWIRASRMPIVAHGQWPSPTPKIVELNRASEADLRLRSARGWILRLAACSQGLSLAPTRPRPCELSPGHALGPSARRAGVCLRPTARISDPRTCPRGPTSLRPPHPAATFRRRSRRAPHRSGMAATILVLQRRSRTKSERPTSYFF